MNANGRQSSFVIIIFDAAAAAAVAQFFLLHSVVPHIINKSEDVNVVRSTDLGRGYTPDQFIHHSSFTVSLYSELLMLKLFNPNKNQRPRK